MARTAMAVGRGAAGSAGAAQPADGRAAGMPPDLGDRIAPAEGVEALRRVLAARHPQVIVSPRDLAGMDHHVGGRGILQGSLRAPARPLRSPGVFRETGPQGLAGLRLGLTVSLILAVVCEMIAGLDGLGQWVLVAARMFRSPDLFAGVILLGAIGFVGALALNALERRLLVWRAPMRG